ncbi:MAG: PEP-CTERM sorting domain-containing protein [Nitrococcus sp.]|nr:PEP-CTERM sorting domain-containing protein [Nitrococcus sp.]
MYKFIARLLVLSTSLALAAGQAGAAVIGVAGGTAAPAATLGLYTMTPFQDDTRPIFDDVSSVVSPLGGAVQFSIPLSHREIGSGWATWSHGYTGDVYFTEGALSVALALPVYTAAFYFYAEPNPFDAFDITAITATGESITQAVAGASGASYFGFYTTGASLLSSIIVSSRVDFAIGEFGIAARQTVPVPATLWLLGVGLAGLGLATRRRIPSV